MYVIQHLLAVCEFFICLSENLALWNKGDSARYELGFVVLFLHKRMRVDQKAIRNGRIHKLSVEGVTRFCRRSSQRGPGTEPLVRGLGQNPLSWTLFHTRPSSLLAVLHMNVLNMQLTCYTHRRQWDIASPLILPLGSAIIRNIIYYYCRHCLRPASLDVAFLSYDSVLVFLCQTDTLVF